MIRLLAGDCRSVLATLPDASVHCVVTSPPYWGLRDYGTAQWSGGDAECQHKADIGARASSGLNGSLAHKDGRVFTPYRDTCGKCGAIRVDRQIGLEATPEAYLETMVAVLREVRRVLRPDGVCFVNVGDSYASGGKRPSQSPARERALACDNGGIGPEDCSAPDYVCRDLCDGCSAALLSRNGTFQPQPLSPQLGAPTAHDSERQGFVPAFASGAPLDAQASTSRVFSSQPRASCSHCANCGACLSVLRSSSRDAQECVRSSWLNIPKFSHPVKPKDLLLMPARLALALQADGWWVRSDIIWHKPNPMPESVTDRPVSSYEHVFLLSKSARYFFDNEAIREPASTTAEVWESKSANWRNGTAKQQQRGDTYHPFKDAKPFENGPNPGGRSCRNVWTIATSPFSQSHFATFPPALVERCIRAGTSERGCCAQCGAPWRRTTETERVKHPNTPGIGGRQIVPGAETSASSCFRTGLVPVITTTGWSPSCTHGGNPVPCTVLDCFAGAGTTLMVADRLQRDAIGIDLNPDYNAMSRARITDDAPLFAAFPVVDPADERQADLWQEPVAK